MIRLKLTYRKAPRLRAMSFKDKKGTRSAFLMKNTLF
jgi:uncharacterized membrane protein (UPF0127 family)